MRRIIGLMSGTSADGIDAVVAEISGGAIGLRTRIVSHIHTPFSSNLSRHILRVGLHGTVAEICELNFLLGERFAVAALAVVRKAKLKPRHVAAIGSHGQTIHHLPNARTPSTLQIGEAAVIAERTGITTIADFRVRDMAAGGQGAPLVPYADWAMFTDSSRPRIVQNIGGVANLTFLPPNAGLSDVIAFDTGPGNMVLDAIVSTLTKGRKTFDRDGHWAASGKISSKLLAEMMSHPYLRRRPPKTGAGTGHRAATSRHVFDLLTDARLWTLRQLSGAVTTCPGRPRSKTVSDEAAAPFSAAFSGSRARERSRRRRVRNKTAEKR